MTAAYHSVQIPADGVVLEADITLPQLARAIVLFAHGSGSSRFSPRNRYVAPSIHW
jgi:putative phosphoribosyl transferase